MIRLHVIRDPETFRRVLDEARKDDHAALCPTHWIEKNGVVVGCFGVNSIPFVSTWFSTKALQPRETLEAISIGEAICENAGFPQVAVPCPETSPLFGVMPKIGYEDTGTVHIFVKELIKQEKGK